MLRRGPWTGHAAEAPDRALAGGLQGWLLKRTAGIERWMLVIAGLMLAYPAPLFDYVGFALLLLTAGLQKMRGGRSEAVAG